MTYEPFGYQKGKGDHTGWYFDIQETNFFGNEIDGVFQSKGRSIHGKDSKQLPAYLKAVDKHLTKNRIYHYIVKLMKSKQGYHKEADKIDETITRVTQYDKQQCKQIHMYF